MTPSERGAPSCWRDQPQFIRLARGRWRGHRTHGELAPVDIDGERKGRRVGTLLQHGDEFVRPVFSRRFSRDETGQDERRDAGSRDRRRAPALRAKSQRLQSFDSQSPDRAERLRGRARKNARLDVGETVAGRRDRRRGLGERRERAVPRPRWRRRARARAVGAPPAPRVRRDPTCPAQIRRRGDRLPGRGS